MVVGLVKFDFVLVVGNFREPIDIRGIVANTIDPDPALSADPFGAAFDIGVSTSDSHLNVFGIFTRDPIFGAGVPDCVARREFALPLDFRRSFVIEIEPPMGDITMVPNPIKQLAAADVVIPAPVHMYPAFDIRLHRCRANPGIVIKFGRWIGRRHESASVGEIGMIGRQANLDMRYFADQTIAHDFSGAAERALRTLPGTGLPYPLVLLDCFNDGLLLGNCSRERLLAVDRSEEHTSELQSRLHLLCRLLLYKT